MQVYNPSITDKQSREQWYSRRKRDHEQGDVNGRSYSDDPKVAWLVVQQKLEHAYNLVVIMDGI